MFVLNENAPTFTSKCVNETFIRKLILWRVFVVFSVIYPSGNIYYY